MLQGMGGMPDPGALAAANPLLAGSIATSLAHGGLDGMALSAGLAAQMPPGGLSGLSLGAPMGGPGAPNGGGPGQGFPGDPGAMGNGGRGPADALAAQNLSKLSAAGRAGGAGPGGPGGAGPPGGGAFAPAGARLWGQKIGSNDKFNEWKLFIGQVPLEVRGALARRPGALPLAGFLLGLHRSLGVRTAACTHGVTGHSCTPRCP